MTEILDQKVPTLRFPEYSVEWDDSKLSKHVKSLDAGVSVNSGDRPANQDEYGILKTSAVTNGVFEPSENKVVFEAHETMRLKEPVQEDTIIISRMNTPVLVGANAHIDESHQNLFLPDRLWAAKPVSESSARFIAYILGSNRGRAALSSRATGTSGTMKNITKPDVLGLHISAPTLPEQQKIASFLSSVDGKIEQLGKKKALLEQYKKGMMQKLFSQELRFKDAQGNDFPDWEEKRLGEVGTFKSGVGFSNVEQGGNDGTPFYKVSDMNLSGNECEMTGANNYVSDEQIRRLKYKPIVKSAIIFAKVGAAIFLERKRLARNFLIDNNMMAFIPNIDLQFAKHVFDATRLSKFAQTGALPSYNGSDLATIKTCIPNAIEEQQKIADFLSSIDRKIDLVSTELDHAMSFKKGLLQQMFV